MGDLSEAFADLNTERMQNAVRRSGPQNKVPRMLPSVVRNEDVYEPKESDDETRPPSLSKSPMPKSIDSTVVMKHIKDMGSEWYTQLSSHDRLTVRKTIAPPDPFHRCLYTNPDTLVFTCVAVALLIGIVVGIAMTKNATDEVCHATPSQTCRRTVKRMLGYANPCRD